MVKSHVDISTRAHDYRELESSKAKIVSNILEHLHIERLIVEHIPPMSKGSSKWSTYNPNDRVD